MSQDSFSEASYDVISTIIRLSGLALLFMGMWVAFHTFNEALAIYKDPNKIERVTIAIEKGSNIDKSINSIPETQSLNNSSQEDSEDKPKHTNIRVSYFVAWVIELLLLLLLTKIAAIAIKTGGELALYNTNIKKLSKHLSNKANR